MNDHSHISETLTLAMSEFVARNYQKCIEYLDPVIQHDPHHKKALLTRGAAHLKLDIESFANENNVWRSLHLRLETMLESDMNR